MISTGAALNPARPFADTKGMFNPEQLKGDVLKRFVVTVESGKTLFNQNDKATTLYIIVQGKLHLTHRSGSAEREVAVLGPGEIVGEKTIISDVPYRRILTATAEGEVIVLELDHASLRAVASRLSEFALKLLDVVVGRLEKANDLVSLLKNEDPTQRAGQYFIYLHRHFGVKQANGVEVKVDRAQAAETCGVPIEVIEKTLADLSGQKALISRGEDKFFISDENAILQAIPSAKPKKAA